MLVSKEYYFEGLSHLSLDTQQSYLQKYLVTKKIEDEGIIEIHKQHKIPVIEFYSMLHRKLHKIVTEVLDNRPRPLSECIKTVTSIITQATITLEKQFLSSSAQKLFIVLMLGYASNPYSEQKRKVCFLYSVNGIPPCHTSQ